MATLDKDLRSSRMPRLIERVWRPSLDVYGPRSARSPFKYQAFVPDAIRDADARLASATVAEVEAAAVAVRELQSSPTFRGLEAVGRQLLRAEALASSRIEGLEMSQRRIAKALADADERDDTARSVIANIAAMQRVELTRVIGQSAVSSPRGPIRGA